MSEEKNEFELFEEELEAASRPSPEFDSETEEPETEPEGEEVSEPETESPEPAPEPDVTGDPEPELPPVETVQSKTYTVPNDPKFGEFAGKKLTAAELDSNGLLEKFNTWEHQELHHTRLYGELKPKFDELEAKVRAFESFQQAAQQQQQALTPERVAMQAQALQTAYQPGLEVLAKSGAFEESFLVEYPKVAAQIEHRFDNGHAALTQLSTRLAAIEEATGIQTANANRTQGQNQVYAAIDRVAEADPATYGQLGDKEIQQKFIQWVIDPGNPLPFKAANAEEFSNPDVIRSAAVLFAQANPDLFVKPEPEVPAAPTPTRAQGTTGRRPARQLGEIEQFEQDMMAAERTRYNR